MKRRLMIALCCLVLLVNILPIAPVAETADFWDVDEDLYYCRAQLAALPNGAALVYAYDNIVAGIDDCATKIEISNKQHKLSLDEFVLALEAVRRDHTEQFWLSTAYSYTPDASGYVVNMLPEYLVQGDALAAAKIAFNQAIDNLLSHLTPSMTEYEKEKTLHDLLATKVTYVSTPNAHNAYGALVEGRAVCEGYAEALQCLLQRAGMQSIQVYGASRGENHAWNMVRVDGKYYIVDLTWNDQETILLYAYFNQTSAIVGEDHEQWRVGHDANHHTELSCQVFDLPVCTATEANYFTKNNLRITTYTVDSIGKLLKDNGLAVSVFVDSNAAQFEQWFGKNISAIATAASVPAGRFSYGIMTIGREVYIYIDTCGHTSLKPVAAAPATCDTDGNVAYYVCQNKDCGKWFSDANAKSEIINHDSVKILAKGHSFTVKTVSDDTLKKKAEKCTEHDTYFLICSVCGEKSNTYTFETESVGDHSYATAWQPDNYNTHKRPCLNGCGEALHEAHTDANEDKICDVCGQEKTMLGAIDSLIPGVDAGETLDEVINIILANPLILLGGGGSVALLVIVVIIKKIRG